MAYKRSIEKIETPLLQVRLGEAPRGLFKKPEPRQTIITIVSAWCQNPIHLGLDGTDTQRRQGAVECKVEQS